MTIHWESLLAVFAVSLSSTIAVVVLVTLAMVGLSARIPQPDGPPGRPPLSARSGTVVAVACLIAAALVVGFGLWALISR